MSRKSKAAGISASSFWDLKSELIKKGASHTSRKATAKTEVQKGGTKWGRSNKGVNERSAKDSAEWARLNAGEEERAQAALKKKAAVYEKLRKGQTGGMSEKQYESLLVDFDEKRMNDVYESDSDDVDESLTVPKPPEEEDPIVEYQDEFGRVRTAKRSEVPREYAFNADEEDDSYDPLEIRGPMAHYPTFDQSAERVAEIQASLDEANNPLSTHYDASRENRAKAAGFYRFSADEETRLREMEELKQRRGETMRNREEMGVEDPPIGTQGQAKESESGDVKGEGNGQLSERSRVAEKRKREIEERRKMIEAKRRKVPPAATLASPERPIASPTESATSSIINSEPSFSIPSSFTPSAPTQQPFNSSTANADDFLANLEKRQNSKAKDKGKAQPLDADGFLASLEREMRQR